MALQMDREKLLYPLCLVLSASFAWILMSWFSIRGTLFEPYPVFMLAAGLFNGGQAFLELFGLNPNSMVADRGPGASLVSGLYLVVLSLLAIHAGALLALGAVNNRQPEIENTLPERQRATRLIGWMLLAIAALPSFRLLWESISIVLDYGYMWLYRRDESISVMWALTGFLVPGIIFLLAGAGQKRAVRVFCLALAGVYAAINLFLGARGAAVVSIVAVAWVFDRVCRRIPRSLILALALAGVVVIAFVRDTRDTSGTARLSLGSQIEQLAKVQNPVASVISEMGYSFVTVTHTLSLVPAVRDYDRGISYLYAASTAVPNLGWDVHPGKAHGLLSDWLVQTVEPMVAAAGGGLGYSFIAEAYLNFGWIGGPLFLAGLGYLLARLFLGADGGDPAHLALVATFLSSLLVFARGESAMVVRGLVWYAFLPYLLVGAISIRNRRKVRPL
jgi:oligosaccharide repeat unit polymerase